MEQMDEFEQGYAQAERDLAFPGDCWKLYDENKARRDAMAREIKKRRASLRADGVPLAIFAVARIGHREMVHDCQRYTFPVSLARTMRRVESLLRYAASPFDDRGMCGHGDYLSELRAEAGRDARIGFEIARVCASMGKA